MLVNTKYKYCNNVFKYIYKYFQILFQKKSSTLKTKKKLANTVETMPKLLSIFMLLIKRSLHYIYLL